MLPLLTLVVALAAQPEPSITRDAYGVPRIQAPSAEAAYESMGRAVAQDRLWQLELSRRMSRGQMAEVLGPDYVAADKEALEQGYTDAELSAQLNALSPDSRLAFEAYARGVNSEIEARTAAGTLPAGYASAGFEPRPWAPEDSAAIAIMMGWRFGANGAGELRNLALLKYLEGSPAKDRALDAFDDLSWFNDPESVPTLVNTDPDDPRRALYFNEPTREQTQAHLALLPRTNIFELLPAVQFARTESLDQVAMAHGLPYRWGSYAVVVPAASSATGYPLLLGAPQMGHSAPSIVHEIVLECPEFRVAGLNVPGVPVIALGTTDRFAWTLTSGVADLRDIYVSPREGEDRYRFGNETLPIELIRRTVKVKGGEPVEVVQRRTRYGIVALESRAGNALYSERSAVWMQELRGFEAIMRAYSAKSPADLEALAPDLTLSFNLFYAFADGPVGYRFCGRVPIRPEGTDPRLPLPGEPEFEWRGFIPVEAMPHGSNGEAPMANWNNKPAAWWSNSDTPVWGSPFRNEALLSALGRGPWTSGHLERAAWEIARRSWEYPAFAYVFAQSEDPQLHAYDGWRLEGSLAAAKHYETMRELRKALFVPAVGGFTSDALLETVVQPHVLLRALRGETRLDYLAGRSIGEVLREAEAAVTTGNEGLRVGGIRYADQPLVAYGDRGTYIFVAELGPWGVRARSVQGPGVAEAGPHAFDQVPLVREFRFKPMVTWGRN